MGYKTPEEAIEAEQPGPECYIDFDGNNCDDCVGWDGRSRRCECGNRRVSWTSSKNDDGTFEAIAEAW